MTVRMTEKRKQRRMSFCAIMVVGAIVLTGCGKKDTPIQPEIEIIQNEVGQNEVEDFSTRQEQLSNEGEHEYSLDYYRNAMMGTNAVAAVLLYSDTYNFTEEEYEFLDSVPSDNRIEISSEVSYLFITRDEDATIKICRLEQSGDNEAAKEELVQELKTKEPVIVNAQALESAPNFCITIEANDGTTVAYKPFVSGNEQKLHPIEEMEIITKKDYNPMIWDATCYDSVMFMTEPDVQDDTATLDAFTDYTDVINNQVEESASSAASISDEMKGTEEIVSFYDSLPQQASTQMEMNQLSQWSQAVWNAQLNKLWSRMSDQLGAETKEKVLSDLRKWNANKENIIKDTIGPAEEGGSMYPMLYYEVMREMTRKKAYQLANVYAKYRGEQFRMPECPAYGGYVNYMDTDTIYDSLILRESMEGGLDATISLYRLTALHGSVTKSGDTLHYQDYDCDLTGTISYGWDGATFTIDTSDRNDIEPGTVYTFDSLI